ncbi:FAD-binding oxidoreductase [Kineosporia sp. A_224]|uniref:FAD-binding oxidoreductase n=1 Tax=Kineosporia sp. A_224 TaxID=1962180 RepID=UPI0018E9920D|nr:FAD-binding oxidoreductase [Kineosporia sp. A_224]
MTEPTATGQTGQADLPPLPTLGGLPPLPTLGPVGRRPPPGGARREWVTATVEACTEETAHARTLRLRLPDGTPAHTPGQHYVVRVRRDDGSWAQRSYSVASAPALPPAPPTVDLTVERLDDGELSPYLHSLHVGDRVELRGPFGGWFVWRGERPVLLVGGGSGVVPLASVLRAWQQRGRPGGDGAMHLVVSVRSPADLFYAAELTGSPDVTVVHTRTAPDGAARPPGRLTVDDLRPYVPAAPDALTVYVCGSAAFAEGATGLVVGAGVPASAVRVEAFGPS